MLTSGFPFNPSFLTNYSTLMACINKKVQPNHGKEEGKKKGLLVP
jgi:hypothetical protein